MSASHAGLLHQLGSVGLYQESKNANSFPTSKFLVLELLVMQASFVSRGRSEFNVRFLGRPPWLVRVGRILTEKYEFPFTFRQKSPDF